ncbi:unnamed protein product [Protopolystoma xenopodis]|uniref:Uncharacterized protein n=1 Tax=Protopolystoma xenopodis TaxID=117903 RepID=A0A448XI25_9PLAT|nr:unnamed protein product [Protopolystoma xenopodis]
MWGPAEHVACRLARPLFQQTHSKEALRFVCFLHSFTLSFSLFLALSQFFGHPGRPNEESRIKLCSGPIMNRDEKRNLRQTNA